MGLYRGIIAVKHSDITPEMKELSLLTKTEKKWSIRFKKQIKRLEEIQKEVYIQLRHRMNPYYYEIYTDEGSFENRSETAMFSYMSFDSFPECAVGLDNKKHMVIQVSNIDWSKTKQYLQSLLDKYIVHYKKNFKREPEISNGFTDYYLSLQNEMNFVEDITISDFESYIKESVSEDDYLIFVQFND